MAVAVEDFVEGSIEIVNMPAAAPAMEPEEISPYQPLVLPDASPDTEIVPDETPNDN